MKRYLMAAALLGIGGLIVASGALATDAPEYRADVTTSFDELLDAVEDNRYAIGDLQEQIGFLTLLDTGSVSFPPFTGTHCEVAWFTHPFTSVPRVYISANHRQHQPPTTHEPITIWMENIRQDRFRVCVREVDADNSHDGHVMIDWLAVD